jgi:2-polyprenyl-3-methyl-5-hydroxy-6-metoxy-1,4-benzoquinol methylase
MDPVPQPDFTEHAAATAATWDALAEWWDAEIGDGNPTQDVLVEPAQERLLAPGPGDLILDAGCGAGRFTRRIAASGAHVVAFDHSRCFITRARERTPPALAELIEYHVLDAHDEDAIVALGARRFTAAVCTMAIMDMAMITPLLRALTRVLEPGARFVFSVTHPAFNSGDAHLLGAQVTRERSVEVVVSAQVTDYLSPRATHDVGISGQPVEQLTFHRPFGVLLNPCFAAGFVLDALEEPALPPAPDADPARIAWANANRIPQVLVARLRLAS